MNQDFVAWVGQGRIADRTKEKLGLTDRGIVMMRRRFFDEMKRVAAGEDPKGTIRDPEKNKVVQLPIANNDTTLRGLTTQDILNDARRRVRLTSYILQAGQPDSIRREMSQVMGIEIGEFEGLPVAKSPKT
jgi:5,5'-dehydrodivanillate O-demethylase